MTKNNKQDLSRRDLLKAGGAITAGLIPAALAGQAKPRSARVLGKIIGANDRVNYGLVGVGMIGSRHLKIVHDFEGTENVQLLGVADLFEKRRVKAQTIAECTDAKIYKDHRALIDNKDI